MDDDDKHWKLKLRYGRLTTPYNHYTVLAEGVVAELAEGFSCPPGSAWMAMKTWASSPDESADMIRVIGKEIGFTVTGRPMYMTPNRCSHPKMIRMAMTSSSLPSILRVDGENAT